MKKLLSILAISGVIGCSSTTVVSCGASQKTDIDLSKIFKPYETEKNPIVIKQGDDGVSTTLGIYMFIWKMITAPVGKSFLPGELNPNVIPDTDGVSLIFTNDAGTSVSDTKLALASELPSSGWDNLTLEIKVSGSNHFKDCDIEGIKVKNAVPATEAIDIKDRKINPIDLSSANKNLDAAKALIYNRLAKRSDLKDSKGHLYTKESNLDPSVFSGYTEPDATGGTTHKDGFLSSDISIELAPGDKGVSLTIKSESHISKYYKAQNNIIIPWTSKG